MHPLLLLFHAPGQQQQQQAGLRAMPQQAREVLVLLLVPLSVLYSPWHRQLYKVRWQVQLQSASLAALVLWLRLQAQTRVSSRLAWGHHMEEGGIAATATAAAVAAAATRAAQ